VEADTTTRSNNSPYGGVKVTKGYFGGGKYNKVLKFTQNPPQNQRF